MALSRTQDYMSHFHGCFNNTLIDIEAVSVSNRQVSIIPGIDIEPHRNPRVSKPTASPIEHGSKSTKRRPGPPEIAQVSKGSKASGTSNMLKRISGYQ